MTLFYHGDFPITNAANFAAHGAPTALFQNPVSDATTMTIRNGNSSPKHRLIRTE
jgi:hypothetical protein